LGIQKHLFIEKGPPSLFPKIPKIAILFYLNTDKKGKYGNARDVISQLLKNLG
jgi:hypothetical protein